VAAKAGNESLLRRHLVLHWTGENPSNSRAFANGRAAGMLRVQDVRFTRARAFL